MITNNGCDIEIKRIYEQSCISTVFEDHFWCGKQIFWMNGRSYENNEWKWNCKAWNFRPVGHDLSHFDDSPIHRRTTSRYVHGQKIASSVDTCYLCNVKYLWTPPPRPIQCSITQPLINFKELKSLLFVKFDNTISRSEVPSLKQISLFGKKFHSSTWLL